MAKYFFLLLLLILLLTSCAAPRPPTPSITMASETWMQQVDTNPTKWTRGASAWFVTGDYNVLEVADLDLPEEATISTTAIQSPVFDKIRIEGDFTVQLYGASEANSIEMYGPNDLTRHVHIEIHEGMLCLIQDKEVSRGMHKAIVRIGVKQLHYLRQLGCGRIEGIRLQSDGLTILSNGGKIYLVGDLNVNTIINTGRGDVNVFGAHGNHLHIKTFGSGDVNVSGRVGLCNIQHHGKNDINVLGATSHPFSIDADGVGRVSVYGSAVKPKTIKAKDMTRVYVYHIESERLHVSATDRAQIGLAGQTRNLYADLYGSSHFYGRRLCTIGAYIHTHDTAHANVSAAHNIAASATDSSSIYFYGTPDRLSQYTNSNATILAIYPLGSCAYTPP